MGEGDVWLFGYGSLIWRPDFPFEEKRDAYLKGFGRRFWQSSPDHRGTEEAPGRVVTLLTKEEIHQLRPEYEAHDIEERVWGSIYRITKDTYAQTMAHLEHREKAGYDLVEVDTFTPEGDLVRSVVFRATPDNDHFIGPSSLEAMANHIATSVGNSGPNVEYFARLVEALEHMKTRTGHEDVVDLHLQSLNSQILSTAKIAESEVTEVMEQQAPAGESKEILSTSEKVND